MSPAPIPTELAELAAQRLDGDLADEAWQALERQHGQALALALAREAAMREALRALPREGAPQRVLDAILAHAAKAQPPAAPAARRGSSVHWWSGAAILAAACLVTGIVLRVDRGDAPTGIPAAASSEPRVARVEPPTERQDGSYQFAAGAPANAAEKAVAARRLGVDSDKLAKAGDAAADEIEPSGKLKNGAARFGADDAKAASAAPPKSEGLARLEEPEQKKVEDFDRLRDEAAAWRQAHPAPAAAPPPGSVIQQADAIGGHLAAKPEAKPQESGQVAGPAEPTAADQEADAAAPLVAQATPSPRKAAPPAALPALDGRRLAGGAPADAPSAGVPNGPLALNDAKQPTAQRAANEESAPAAKEELRGNAVVATTSALLVLDGAGTAVMTLENRDTAPLLVRRASLTLEGVGSNGAAAWTLTTGQPESDTTLPPSGRASWRAPLAGAAALQGATRLRLRFRDAVSPAVAWPPPPAAAAAPAAQPAKP